MSVWMNPNKGTLQAPIILKNAAIPSYNTMIILKVCFYFFTFTVSSFIFNSPRVIRCVDRFFLIELIDNELFTG